MIERETIPCEVCGTPTPYKGTKRCDNCWEVEWRLPRYLQSLKGQAFVHKQMPVLDDWDDSLDYEAVLRENEVTVAWENQLVDGSGYIFDAHPNLCGWGLSWRHGAIFLGNVENVIALKAAALFVSLWLRGVAASLSVVLVRGYIQHLELQAGQ